MPRFVALLRAVNVGKGNRVPMAELRALGKLGRRVTTRNWATVLQLQALLRDVGS